MNTIKYDLALDGVIQFKVTLVGSFVNAHL